ncbi:hypothetical protein ACROYT_G028996 [Oculina patagonica]
MNTAKEQMEKDINELRRRHVKLECHSRRGNLKFYGVKEQVNESNNDTETVLREFMRTKLKIPPSDEEQIQFDRVHRISSRKRDGRSSGPRPIIVKPSVYQDKNFIKSFIKNLPKGTNIGISDDFPKEVDEIRKSLYPILKASKRDKKEDAIGRWEAEWGGKIVSSHGSSHSRGVMILFKPRLDVNIEKITEDKYGRYIVAEIVIDNTKVILVNVYAPNDPNQQVVFLRELSNNILSNYDVFAKKHQEIEDKGLFWEMIKIEIRAFTIQFSKKKAKSKRDEESALLLEMTKLQCKLQTEYSDSLKSDLERIKSKLTRIASVKTRGTIIRSRVRWYEHGERNSKYFYSLEKTNHRKKHITSLVINDQEKITDPKEILEEEERFFKRIYTSQNMNPNDSAFDEFFKTDNALSEENATSCEGLMSIDECERALLLMKGNKTPGTDGLTAEFYRYFWNAVGKFMVESFNYALEHGSLSISQRQGIISLIPKKNKNAEYLKNWRPVSLLNVDYKVATKTIALRMERILPSIIHPCQSGYVKGRFIGESIRLIADTMDFTKINDIPGIAVFLDFEKAFDSIEWDFIQKCLESFKFGPNLRQWINVFYKDISSCVINNGVASKHFLLERGVRQGCPLSGILFVIAMELFAQSIRRSKDIKGINIQGAEEVKLSQYADDTTTLLADVQSVSNLFDLLLLFEKCSGLKINQTKSEMLWLGSLRHRKDAIFNLQISDEPVYALGVHFNYNNEASQKKNFLEKLGPLKKTLSIWSRRDISIYGRINIVKTLALSKLVFICSVMGTPKNFAKEVNNIVFDFIWKQKPPKIKKDHPYQKEIRWWSRYERFCSFRQSFKIDLG